jgi:hypothetical protein
MGETDDEMKSMIMSPPKTIINIKKHVEKKPKEQKQKAEGWSEEKQAQRRREKEEVRERIRLEERKRRKEEAINALNVAKDDSVASFVRDHMECTGVETDKVNRAMLFTVFNAKYPNEKGKKTFVGKAAFLMKLKPLLGEDNFVERSNNLREVFIGWKLKEGFDGGALKVCNQKKFNTPNPISSLLPPSQSKPKPNSKKMKKRL